MHFIGRQYKHQYMYVGGQGQQNKLSISKMYGLSVGRYRMLVELETPNDALVGEEIKLKVSMHSSEISMMLGAVYNDPLMIEDKLAQKFYKQMYNSMAMQEEER